MDGRSSQLGAALRGLGLERGERVLVVLPRLVEWWESMLGVLKAGLVAIPGTPLLTAGDVAYRIRAADVSAIITDAAGAERVRHVADQLPMLKHNIAVGAAAHAGWRAYEELIRTAS